MKQFTMRNESFVCEHCGKVVKKASKTARDHCPFCLYSKHVDILPGDRANPCLGSLEPIGIEKFKQTYKIIYRCRTCGQVHKNIACTDDNPDLMIELSTRG